MNVRYSHSDVIADSIRSFYFIKPEGFRHVAGQFIELTLPHPNPDERGIKHWFTLSSAPTQEQLSITTKLDPEHGSSFKRTLAALQPSQEVQMSEPMGDFVLPKDPGLPMVFAAGGIGVTPFHAMIQWLVDTKSSRDIILLYSARNKQQLAFTELFDQPFITSHYLTENQPLSAATIHELAGPLDKKQVYISGPEPMIEALAKELALPEHQLITDYFPGYTSL